MLTFTDGKLIKSPTVQTMPSQVSGNGGVNAGNYAGNYTGGSMDGSNGFTVGDSAYAGAVGCVNCSDKTAKAIEILKVLQKEKRIKCDSVPKFIELVEKIAAIL